MENREKNTQKTQNIQQDNKPREIENNVSNFQNIEIENLKIQLSNNQNKINDIKLRTLANIDNIKKNAEKTIKNIKLKKTSNFFKNIIPIIDSLEDVLLFCNNLKTENTPLLKGIELTLQSLFNLLCTSKVKIEGKKCEIFNSKIHHIASTQKSKKIPENHIISVYKKGFTFNKIVLRKAEVIICKN
ncbi:MAG: nucleotide exchange factor GrpE [Buchnera aphidicola (Pentalonia nigronervosa)]|uniref:Protein GrpE n=1 Tax=Buchnera aphidicola (Pentalonia nigronervosa) TaxID=1309793 RepID=A0A7H1AZK4_9GAMM|nr:MAG: nucleotide exchange factor GrpE [Buchnera aphidicola (Pentalonia nigronervosa)]